MVKKKYSEIKQGEVFKFGGQSWIKLEEEGLALMKGILEERPFDEECNNWGKSEVRKYLNNEFYKKLIKDGADEEDFLSVKTNLMADDGTNKYAACYDYISLMTTDLYRHNRHLLDPLNGWWWLATPHSCLVSGAGDVLCVSSSGTLGSIYAYKGYCGVRPLCNLSAETLVSVRGEDKKNTESLFEKIKKWAIDRNLHEADPCEQMLKLTEETGELAEGIAKNRSAQIGDSIGDIIVVLTVLSLQLGLDIEECMKVAHNEIKDRKE